MKSKSEIIEGLETYDTGLCISDIEEAMQVYANQQSIDFGRWLLAETEIVLDKNGAWLWNYCDKDLNTSELFDIYIKENSNE